MAKAELKTKVNDASLTKFLQRRRRAETERLLRDPQDHEADHQRGAEDVAFEHGRLWQLSLQRKSGREGDWMLTGFSPRKQNLTLYLTGGFDTHAALLKKTWQVHNRRGMFVYQDTGRCGQEGLERVGAGVCQENEPA